MQESEITRQRSVPEPFGVSAGLAPAGRQLAGYITGQTEMALRRACPGGSGDWPTGATMEPIYALDNTTPAFQLNWSVSLFGPVPFPPSGEWLEQR